MINKKYVSALVAEALGTGVLTLVILSILQSPIGISFFVSIGVALTIAVLVAVFAQVSGGHFNPVVTISQWVLRRIDSFKAILYIVFQFLGAAGALFMFEYLSGRPLLELSGEATSTTALVAEAVGAFVFILAVSIATTKSFDNNKVASVIGGSLGIAVLVASVGGNGIVNPAVALGINSWNTAYVAGPIIGALLATIVYMVMFVEILPVNPMPGKSRIKKANIASRTSRKTARKK